MADMWIHESFTNYSENLFTEYYYGKEAGAAYVIGCRKLIQNKYPIIGAYNVNDEGKDTDKYYKGGNMLHTLRQILNDDEKWRQILRGLNKTFYHQTVETKQIEDFLSKETGRDLSKFFDQYLRNTQLPKLEYKIEKNRIKYRWTNTVKGFNMPVKISLVKANQNLHKIIKPTSEWKKIKAKKVNSLKVDENYYVESVEIK
jgi:aminopeptidase N